MEKLITIWNLLNGKKVTIGALMMLAAQALRLAGQPEWGEWVDKLYNVLNGAGAFTVTAGAVHKAVKVSSSK